MSKSFSSGGFAGVRFASVRLAWPRASGAAAAWQCSSAGRVWQHGRRRAVEATVLALLLSACQSSPATRAVVPSFNVRNYGATGSGKVNEQRAIQAALDACAGSGGGRVVLPPGDYYSGALRLGSGVTLYLERGATLWASTNRHDYTAGDGRHFLVALDAECVTLSGPGVIHGQAVADYGERWGVPDKPPFRSGILWFKNCRDVAVREVTILNSDAWTLHFQRCENVTVEDVTIRNNYRRLNSDGIDPNGCRNVRIARCRIVAGDDCIVLKSTEPAPCENVTVTDCVLESAASALKLGTESHGDFRNITFSRCVISNSPTGIGLYLKDGATMEHIVFSDIVIQPCGLTNRAITPVFVDIERRHADSRVGRIREVRFEGLDITSDWGVLVQGMPESPIDRLTFRDVRFRVPQGGDYSGRRKPVGGHRTTRDERDTCFARLPSYFTVAHARDLRLENVRVEIADAAFRRFPRSAFCGRFVERGSLLHVSRVPAETPGAPPVLDLEACRGLTVRDF